MILHYIQFKLCAFSLKIFILHEVNLLIYLFLTSPKSYDKRLKPWALNFISLKGKLITVQDDSRVIEA